MPFIHMNIKPDKSATACWRCHAKLGDYTTDSLEDIWHSEKWQEFREKHLNNQRPSECRSCWEMEDAGIKSTRQTVIEEYTQEIENLKSCNNLKEPPLPNDMEFRFGNLCNLKCRHCSPKYSSQWVTQCKKDPQFYSTMQELANSSLDYSINELPDDTMEQLKKFAPTLKTIRITGGEPLMHPMHYEMLDVLLPYAENITLEYNTNLHYLKNVLDYWPKFKKVICRVSIDADIDTYPYIREGGNIDTLIENWNIVSKEMHNSKNFDIHATCTMNVLNAVKIDKVVEFFTDLGSRLHVSFVQYPQFMDICNLPDWQKQQVSILCDKGLKYVAARGTKIQKHHAIQSIGKIKKWLEKPSNAEFENNFARWMKAQDLINNNCLFDYYTEFDYLKEKYYA